MYKDIANELLSFIQKSPSCFHAVNTMKDMLLEDGYTELRECEAWTLEKGGKYFTTRNGSSLIAFHIGSSLEDYHFQVTSSHSDSPTFKVNGRLWWYAVRNMDGSPAVFSRTCSCERRKYLYKQAGKL